MQNTIDTPKEPEAVLLARVYALILSWSEPDAQTRADAANARTPRKAQTKKREEVKSNA